MRLRQIGGTQLYERRTGPVGHRVERRRGLSAISFCDVDHVALENQLEFAQQSRCRHRVPRGIAGRDQRGDDDILGAPQQQTRGGNVQSLGEPGHGFVRVVGDGGAVCFEIEAEVAEAVAHGERGRADDERACRAGRQGGLMDPRGREDDGIGVHAGSFKQKRPGHHGDGRAGGAGDAGSGQAAAKARSSSSRPSFAVTRSSAAAISA